MLRFTLFIPIFFTAMNTHAQPKTDSHLKSILEENNNPVFRKVIDRSSDYRLQIIYTEINRDKNNKPSFKNHYFNFDPELYFNPASMVKMPLAFLSLEKLNLCGAAGVDRNTTILFDSSMNWQTALHQDASSASGLPSIAHLIKRALLVSENDPYNRMYQYLGQGYINRQLHKKGYKDVRITRQFLGLTAEQNRHTNAVRFLDEKGNVVCEQPPAYNEDPFDFSRTIKIGNAHYNRNDELVQSPFDFTEHNYLSLESMQQMLQAVLFPASVPAKKRFDISGDDLQFLYRYLSQYPSETPDPKYDAEKYYDSYVKFFFRDSSKKMPPGLRVFNKVGWSYGFLTDVSYVADFDNQIEYMLAATVYVNSDGILNDNEYDYIETGYPFLYQLGQTIYEHEKKRKRNFFPDLADFRIRYEQRDKNDKRAVLSDVDN